MIRFANVTHRYPGGNEGLRQVSFEVGAGEFVFITGHSGAGKSTLLRLVALMERCARGEVLIDGRNLAQVAPAAVPYYRRRLGLIFQQHHLLERRSVYENVALPLMVSGIAEREARKRVRAALDKVGLLPRERAEAGTLSTGEQQRVSIARAVVNRPLMLLADEPTGNLDPALSREILTLFRQFNEVGVTVLVASHDVSLVRQFGGRELELADGRLLTGDTRAA